MSEEATGSDLLDVLRSAVGQQSRANTARDAVNPSMIRHWCDAMTDANPVYTDPEAASKSVHGEIVAPPSMLNAWTMLGLIPRPVDPGGGGPLQALDAAGYSSVVATNCEHEYERYLRVGDLLTGTEVVTDVSAEKQTGLGIGHFVTSTTTYRNQDDEVVGRMLFRILKFKPGTGRGAGAGADAENAPRMQRPEPGILHDTAFFWEGLDAGELRIQRCNGCEALHHPPVVRCPGCGSYDLGHQVAGGRGHVYSFVEVNHPQIPAFDYPLVVGLVELEEGTRLLTNIVDLAAERMEIGMPVELVLREVSPGRTLPMFRPVRPPRRSDTLRFDEVEVGQALPPCPIDITATLIVAGAMASRDYQDVHHDRDLAVKRGSPDIFTNILTSSGLCARYVTDWAGTEALMRNLKIRLGAPNYPGDVMTMEGSVLAKERRDGQGIATVGVRGYNRLGDHATGTIDLALP